MNIDGTTINADLISIVETLKKQLEERGVYRFAKYFDSGNDVMVCCPYHKEGQERRPSAGIRKSDGLFHCLACGETHSLPEVIADCFGYNNSMQGYKWLIQTFSTVGVQERERLNVNFRRLNNADVCNVVPTTVSEEELDTYRYTHPYMYKRGLTDAVIDYFDIGYDKASDCITFPVRNVSGDCMFVARRSVKTKYFDLPKGIDKPLYGLYEVMQVDKADKVYVCEGLFDCLRFWCNGKVAVAGFGCLFNKYQIKQLQTLPCRTLVLALDDDTAGWKANERLRKFLTNKIIKEIELPSGRKDVGECTDEEIQNFKEILL